MIDDIDNILNLLEDLNTTLNMKISTPEEIKEGKENIANLQNDLAQLRETIKNTSKSSTTDTLAHIYIYYGDIIQDLQNINKVIMASIKRYSECLEDE